MKRKADAASGYRISAVATLAAAVAGITSLSGLLQLRIAALQSTPLIETQPLPPASWPHQWLGAARSARSLQTAAVVEWLNLVLLLLAMIVVIAGISALIGLFAHATSRRYETALAAVVGAPKQRLRSELLERAAINAAAALVIGISVGLLIASIANRTWPHDRSGTAPFAWLILSVGFAGLIAALAANAAAGRMNHPGWLGDALAPEARTNPGYGADDLRRALLHAQFAFTFALITVAMLVARNARALPPGAITADEKYVSRVAIDEHLMPAQRKALLSAVRAQLERTAAIASPGALIGTGPTDQVISHCGRCVMANMYAPMFPVRTQQHVVSDGFFEAAGVSLLAGREFSPGTGSPKQVVVNDTFANIAFQGQPAIGKQIQVGGFGGERYTVIGVVEDIAANGLQSFAPDVHSVGRSNRPGHEAAIYFNAAEKPMMAFDVIGDRGVDVQMAGVQTTSIQRKAELVAEARAPARWFAGILGALSLAAAAIALAALAAITLLNVKQHELEIAARRAVGARRRDIIRMTVTGSMAVAGRGTVVGIILSVGLARAVQMMMPELRLLDVQVLAAATILLAAVSLVAAVIPARAAASVPPARVHV